ncbi:MAG: hypothetical protein QG583_706 [Patescibacteria group bacterium]|nr:hypothetical protein [Patescibacteria group bacterium]
MIKNIVLFVIGLASIAGAVYCFMNWRGIYFPKSEDSIYANGMLILLLFGALMFHMIKKKE